MQPERWQQVKLVLETALEKSEAERDSYLDAACAEDADLRREVDSYLSTNSEETDVFENHLLQNRIWNDFTESDSAYIGRSFGKYKITREIGAGGMGRVFLAERADGEFEQTVALKFLRQGLDTPGSLRRFALERQILARLNHPNIARLIDGGTTEDNVPYLVMEYVEGFSVDDYCRRKNCSLTERLELFRTICAAISFAHRHLIVHRDLKPSNILVTENGTPKLLDFGIAKLLSNNPIKATLTRFQVLTPEYASPEQFRGEEITTASDVYALGVILYELLTGAPPYRFENNRLEEIFKTINRSEPLAPSRAAKRQFQITNDELREDKDSRFKLQASKSLKGDLDNIILKALKKEPERRYSTVEQFSEDIERYLRGLPVVARRDTFFYRTEKFVRRNFLIVAAALLVFSSLLAGIIVANRQASIARRERARAEQRFNEVRQLANSLLFDFYDALPETPGSTKVRGQMVERALSYLDKLAGEASDDAALQRELATAYLKIGDMQGRPNMANSGNTQSALESYHKAAAILENLTKIDASNQENLSDLTVALENIGRVQAVSSDYKAALETHRKVLSMRENLAAQNPENSEYRRMIADSYRLIGDAMGEDFVMTEKRELLSEQMENYRRALDIHSRLLTIEPSNNLQMRMIAILHQRIGSTLYNLGSETGETENFRAAMENHRQALSEWVAANPEDVNGRFPAGEYKYIGSAQSSLGQTSEAIANFAKARAIFESLTAGDTNSAEYRRELAYLQLETAKTFVKANRRAQAIENYRQALAIFEQLAASDPARVTDNYRNMESGYQSLGELLEEEGAQQEAATNYRKAAQIGEKWLAIAPSNDALRNRQKEISIKLTQIENR